MGGNSFVVRFDDTSADQHALVGGKAASLGRLVKAGFPVPAGFSISTDGYRAFMSGLQTQVASILAHADYSDAAHLEQQAQAIRALICNTPLPDDLCVAITTGYADLQAKHGAGS